MNDYPYISWCIFDRLADKSQAGSQVVGENSHGKISLKLINTSLVTSAFAKFIRIRPTTMFL